MTALNTFIDSKHFVYAAALTAKLQKQGGGKKMHRKLKRTGTKRCSVFGV